MDKQKLIEQYLTKSLTKEEEREFHRLMDSDPEFKADLNFHLGIKKALILEKEEALGSKLVGYENAYQRTKSIQRTLFRITVAAALIISMLLVVLKYNKTPVEANQLFLSYFTPAENIHYPITRGESDTLIVQAFTAYEQGQFDKALELLLLMQGTGQYEGLDLYIGSAYLAIGEVNNAIKVLNPNNVKDSLLLYRYKWYQSLSYVKSSEYDSARILLEDIVAKKAFKSEKASLLLKKLPQD
ncbi:hypothetical protein MM213_03025 [Belliella sp. R4-6]|uniref:Tetratricopeptide repeat-containing protein n=1 Tax=Belliella alkalica TaxID=1730871 RepID=A0ABS9V7P7_9BACT|nr:hypothetical protein [Belliella alkalica]MCH7412443.1 hypothetical protein [Belliella alkalica]